MQFGVATDVIDDGVPVVELARAVEDAGLESLWLTRHTHVRASRMDILEDEFHATDSRLLDPFVALAVAGGCR